MSRYLLQTCLGSFWQNTPTLDNYNTSIVPAALVAPTTAASASAVFSVCFIPTALPSLAIRSCTCGIAPHASHLGHQGFLVFPSSRGPLRVGQEKQAAPLRQNFFFGGQGCRCGQLFLVSVYRCRWHPPGRRKRGGFKFI
ncbi:hypothetical protein AAFF_G00290680 [Aldrovandia affinis]|uniref:Uncharacterized protein n=1 Tax=Aldrovandia affinis TaxID=143900 RepID=A0AAD7RA02_9TELE|nr:hypothetical protein AAFF_G00290680 [Aldrovandia affinis]